MVLDEKFDDKCECNNILLQQINFIEKVTYGTKSTIYQVQQIYTKFNHTVTLKQIIWVDHGFLTSQYFNFWVYYGRDLNQLVYMCKMREKMLSKK